MTVASLSTTWRNNRWSGARVASPTALESADSKLHLSAMYGTVVNSVNVETSQLYQGGNLNKFVQCNFLEAPKASFSVSLLERFVGL